MNENQNEAIDSEGIGLIAGRSSPLKLAVRVGIGGIFIGTLLWRSDIEAITRALGRANLFHVALSVLLMLGVQVVSAFRWRAFLTPLGLGLSASSALRITFVGVFFNAFLPTGVGGDAYKAIRLRRGPGTFARALASVLLDRFAGIVGLALIALLGITTSLMARDHRAVIGLAALSVAAILTVAVLLLVRGDRLLGRGDSTWFGLRPKLGRALKAAALAGRDPRAARWGLLGGLVAQSLMLSAHLVLTRALMLDLPLRALMACLLIATVAATLPITINGLGVREGVWVWSLGNYGIASSSALAFALLVLGASLVSSAVGGLVYMVAGGQVATKLDDRPPAGDPEARRSDLRKSR